VAKYAINDGIILLGDEAHAYDAYNLALRITHGLSFILMDVP